MFHEEASLHHLLSIFTSCLFTTESLPSHKNVSPFCHMFISRFKVENLRALIFFWCLDTIVMIQYIGNKVEMSHPARIGLLRFEVKFSQLTFTAAGNLWLIVIMDQLLKWISVFSVYFYLCRCPCPVALYASSRRPTSSDLCLYTHKEVIKLLQFYLYKHANKTLLWHHC